MTVRGPSTTMSGDRKPLVSMREIAAEAASGLLVAPLPDQRPVLVTEAPDRPAAPANRPYAATRINGQ